MQAPPGWEMISGVSGAGFNIWFCKRVEREFYAIFHSDDACTTFVQGKCHATRESGEKAIKDIHRALEHADYSADILRTPIKPIYPPMWGTF